jgi:2-methylcitrate dehydratase PrpD
MATWLCPGITAFGLHPPGMLGAFGATAAVARLLDHDADHLAGSLRWCGGAAPLSPFEAFTAGASAKDLYGGWPGFVGVTLAQRSPPREPWFGLDRLLGRESVDPSIALAAIREPGLLHADFKPYPTCRSIQPALTALEALLAARAIPVDEIVALDVETYAYAVELDESSATDTPIGARTSLKTCLALRLVSGPLGPEHFTRERLGDPRVLRLAHACRVSVGRFAGSPLRGARVSLRLADGSSRSHEVAAAKWSTDQSASPEELRRKFRSLAEPAIGAAAAGELEERTLNLASLTTVRPLLELLASPHVEGEPLPVTPPGQPTGLAARLGELAPEMADTLVGRGADASVLQRTIAAIRTAAQPFDSATLERALSLALCLAPSGAGPTPDDWPDLVGSWAARLAAVGFGGPASVIDGRRGLGRLLARM